MVLTLREGVEHRSSETLVEPCYAFFGVYVEEDLQHRFLLARQRLYPRLGTVKGQLKSS